SPPARTQSVLTIPMGDNTVKGMSKSDEERSKAEICSNIIQFKHARNGSNYPNHQQARADPSQKLKEVFGIDNIFTNKTNNTKHFVEKVEKLMWKAMKANSFRDDGDWRDLRN
ncbi:hypothetical protein PtrSN002B_012046, partial [Pyrenophora tritici-repentis]